jgi:hypothetical protein|nr:MAG TPA: hypothetical protein [Caudoviricetes sp.]
MKKQTFVDIIKGIQQQQEQDRKTTDWVNYTTICVW